MGVGFSADVGPISISCFPPMYFYNLYRVSRFNLWFYDCAPRRVLYILGKWAIIEAELQPLATRMLGKELITAARIERQVQFVDSQREMKTFKNQKTVACNLRAAAAEIIFCWRPNWMIAARPPLCFSLVWVMGYACAVMERPQYNMHA